MMQVYWRAMQVHVLISIQMQPPIRMTSDCQLLILTLTAAT